MDGMPFGIDPFFTVFIIIFAIVFVLVLGIIIFAIVKTITRSAQNRNAPILSVDAKITSKRTETSGGMNDTSVSTCYYVTFEVASGDRMEFQVNGEQSGMLAEGDEGKVTFQGTRYLSFQRMPKQTS